MMPHGGVYAASTTSARTASAHSLTSRSYSARCSFDRRTRGSDHSRLIWAFTAAEERTGPEAGGLGGMPSAYRADRRNTHAAYGFFKTRSAASNARCHGYSFGRP